MVSIHTLHFLIIGIFFITVSQFAPFQESLLSFMLTIGIIVMVLAIIFRTIKAVGMKIKNEIMTKEKYQQKNLISKNCYFTYLLIALAFISTFYGYVTMASPLSLNKSSHLILFLLIIDL